MSTEDDPDQAQSAQAHQQHRQHVVPDACGHAVGLVGRDARDRHPPRVADRDVRLDRLLVGYQAHSASKRRLEGVVVDVGRCLVGPEDVVAVRIEDGRRFGRVLQMELFDLVLEGTDDDDDPVVAVRHRAGERHHLVVQRRRLVGRLRVPDLLV
ncbi:PH domain-containing protein [Natronobacterium lacisalsi]|uniref:PH domain-containing protein n=1 Tax=Natronobacterium lacisalsi TaxID=229731 RepID=UPI00373AF1F7